MHAGSTGVRQVLLPNAWLQWLFLTKGGDKMAEYYDIVP